MIGLWRTIRREVKPTDSFVYFEITRQGRRLYVEETGCLLPRHNLSATDFQTWQAAHFDS